MSKCVMQRFVLIAEEEYEKLIKLKDKSTAMGQINKGPVKDDLGAGQVLKPADPISLPPPGVPALGLDQHGEDWASFWQKPS